MKGLDGTLCVLLSVIMLSATACQCGIASDSKVDSVSSERKETGTYIAENAESDYQIVIPETAKEKELLAAQELQYFFEEATDIKLDIITDTNITYNSYAKYFSIGETKFVTELNIEADSEILGSQGFLQKTVGNTMFFLGATQYGTLYSLYDYLEEEFHYNYFNANAYYIDKAIKTVPLREYDDLTKPDIGSLEISSGNMAVGDEANVHDRYRMVKRSVTVMAINGTTSVHNMCLILPIAENGAEHPDWYTNHTEWKANPDTLSQYDGATHVPENLCLTAHGNAAEYSLLVGAFCEQIFEEFEAGSTATFLMLGQMDGVASCDCPTCKANTIRYGAISASAILFCNDVLDEIYAWFETEDGKAYKRDFYINVLAYLDYEDAPVTYHADTDSFTLNANLEVHDKIGYVMAPIGYDFGMTSANTKNQSMYQNMRAWSFVGNACMYYVYDLNYIHYLAPYETLTSKQELYKLMKESDCLHLYDQGYWNVAGLSTGWSLLRTYISSKLRWNVDLDINQLIYDYFYGVYGAAADVMYDMYWSYRSYWSDIREKAAVGADGLQAIWVNKLNGEFLKREVWSYSVLTGWLREYDKAFALVEPLKKSNPTQYKSIERNLCVERVSTVYLLLALYSDRYTKAEQEALISILKYDSELTRISLLAEQGGETVDSFIAKIRANV